MSDAVSSSRTISTPGAEADDHEALLGVGQALIERALAPRSLRRCSSAASWPAAAAIAWKLRISGPRKIRLTRAVLAGLQRAIGDDVERHEGVEGGLQAREDRALARLGERHGAASGEQPPDVLRRALELRPAGAVVVAVGGLPAVDVGDRVLDLERERLARRSRAETSSKRSLSDWNAAKATAMVMTGPRMVITMAA